MKQTVSYCRWRNSKAKMSICSSLLVPKKTISITATPIGRQTRLLDLTHFYKTFHGEAGMLKQSRTFDYDAFSRRDGKTGNFKLTQ